MSKLFETLWLVFLEVFKAIYGIGFIGCGIVLVFSALIRNWGLRIAGRPPITTIHSTPFGTNVWMTPAVEGSAQTRLGHYVGCLMQFVGGLLLWIATFALVALIFMYIVRRHP